MPKRGELNKARILDAALVLVDSGGTEAITMRRVADQLGASPMGLYRHVASRDEILEGLVDQALEAVTVDTDPDSAWDEQMRQVFSGVHRTLLEHPGLIAVLSTQPISAERAMRAVEGLLATLRTAGFSADAAVAAVAAAQSYTFGFTVQQRARSASGQQAHVDTLRSLPAADYPHLHEVAADFGSWTSEEHFTTGLDWLLAGIRESRQGG